MTFSFRPLPFLGNPHVQTVLGNLFRGPDLHLPAQCRVIPLPDGDNLVIHETTPSRWRPGQALAILVHGLGGSHRSSYMCRVANDLNTRGLRVVRVDLRGAGAGVALTSKLYNAACSHDIRAVAEALYRETPASPILLAGFSLGGNIVLKLAGEAGDNPLPGLHAVAALAPPIDLVQCCTMLERLPFYDHHYARSLIRQVRRHQRRCPHLPATSFPRNLTLRGFDDLYTAPRGGFADAMDYYRRASSAPLIHKIQVPTFMLTARDDPFIAVEPFESLQPRDHLEVIILPRGGHLGFLGFDGAGGIRWAERRIIDWLMNSSRSA